MYKKIVLPSILIGIIVMLFAACDKDYEGLGATILGEDHFGSNVDYSKTVKTYNQGLGPIASNNLPVNPLGFYENPAFGTTQANFVTQVEMAVAGPTFNNVEPNDNSFQNPTEIDSVILNIPYFVKRNKTVLNTDGITKTYYLDSICGTASKENHFKLSVYQSNYFLRDIDPSQSLGQSQLFYTDKDAEIDSHKLPVLLNDASNEVENDAFYFDVNEHKLTAKNTKGEDVVTRTAPSMRLHLNKNVFTNLILHAPSGQLANNAVFKNYFRGLYFKAENGNPGHMAMLNFKGGNITIYYKEDLPPTLVNGVNTFKRSDTKTFVLNLSGNTISLLNNSNENTDYLNALANPSQEADKLFLKGGQGATAIIDLFGSADLYHYVVKKDGNGKPIDENGSKIALDFNNKPVQGYLVYEKDPTPNGIPDELDDLRYPEYATKNNVTYYSEKNRWMLNEASLTFYVDNMKGAKEPNRIFLYDLKNKKALPDYNNDATSSSGNAKLNKYVFGGILMNEDGTIVNVDKSQTGFKYKIRITNHLKNLIYKDSTNVRLGLSVSESINNVGFSKVKTTNANFDKAPTMSVASPLGTILHGSASSDPNKKLKLEINYTKPN